MGAPAARPGQHYFYRSARPRRDRADRLQQGAGAGGARARGGVARGVRDGGAGEGGAAAEAQSRPGQRRSGSVCLGAAHPELGEDAALRGGRRSERERRDAAALPLYRFAAHASAAEYRAAPPDFSGDSQNAGRAGVLRNRDAHADALDSGGRARLPGAQPDPSRAILRAAAIAADFQADPDDRGPGPLLSNRALLPGRGFARGPAAGVHAARSGDVFSHAGGHLRGDRAGDGAGLRGGGDRSQGALSAHGVPRSDPALRHRQAGPALRNGAARGYRAVRGGARKAAFGRQRASYRGAGRGEFFAQAAGRIGRTGQGAGRARALHDKSDGGGRELVAGENAGRGGGAEYRRGVGSQGRRPDPGGFGGGADSGNRCGGADRRANCGWRWPSG